MIDPIPSTATGRGGEKLRASPSQSGPGCLGGVGRGSRIKHGHSEPATATQSHPQVLAGPALGHRGNDILDGQGARTQAAPRTRRHLGSRRSTEKTHSMTWPIRPSKRIQDIPLESDNLTFRPTVLIRRGASQGSGTIIASLDADTLVLTASHVVRGSGPIQVEFHRYNLGVEKASHYSGNWPRHVAAEVAASDTAADLAILRIRSMVALPYVARLAAAENDPETNATLTSVGIDLGAKLSSWKTRLVETLWFELNDGGKDRPFLVTAKIPEHGRSGGGLFDKDGQLVGVCVGHAELERGGGWASSLRLRGPKVARESRADLGGRSLRSPSRPARPKSHFLGTSPESAPSLGRHTDGSQRTIDSVEALSRRGSRRECTPRECTSGFPLTRSKVSTMGCAGRFGG